MRKRGVKKTLGPSLILKWGSLAACAFALFAVFGNQGLLKLHNMQKTESRLEEMLQDLQRNNAELTHEIEKLQDKEYLESIVRQEMGFLRSDEVIYFVGKKER